jgi:nitric oxide reductase NorQ protein
VVHLEEINRPEHPKALNELFSVLSENRCIWTDQVGLMEVAPGVVFFATMNEGDEFIGTDSLDAALRDRFYIISLDYLPGDVEQKVLCLKAGISEKDAQLIIKIVHKLRGNSQFPLPVSTRHSLMMAELMAAGASVREAMVYSLQVSKDMVESVLLSIHAETGDVQVRKNKFVLFLPDRGCVT